MSQRTRKAVTSGRIKAGVALEGDIVLKTPIKKQHGVQDFLPPLPDLRFNAGPWDKSRKAFDDEVTVLLLKIDIAKQQLGCAAQAREDDRQLNLIPRWAGFAEPTSAYAVISA